MSGYSKIIKEEDQLDDIEIQDLQIDCLYRLKDYNYWWSGFKPLT